jgi:hypothetical protein
VDSVIQSPQFSSGLRNENIQTETIVELVITLFGLYVFDLIIGQWTNTLGDFDTFFDVSEYTSKIPPKISDVNKRYRMWIDSRNRKTRLVSGFFRSIWTAWDC